MFHLVGVLNDNYGHHNQFTSRYLRHALVLMIEKRFKSKRTEVYKRITRRSRVGVFLGGFCDRR